MKGIVTTTLVCFILPFAEFGQREEPKLTIVWLSLSLPEHIVWAGLVFLHFSLLVSATLQNQGLMYRPYVDLAKSDSDKKVSHEAGREYMEMRFYILHIFNKVILFYLAWVALFVSIYFTYKTSAAYYGL